MNKKKLKKLVKSVKAKLNKHLKSVKKRLEKVLKSVSEFARAQKFYLIEGLKEAGKTGIAAVRLAILAVVMVFSALFAHVAHNQYLEHTVAPQVVFIRSPEGAERRGSGTGFQLKAPSGKVYTITNAHICGLQKDGVVMVEDKLHAKRLLPKRVIEVYAENDLCVVEGLEGYEGLELGEEQNVGSLVWAIGYPLGEALNISNGRIKEFTEIYLMDETVKTPEACVGPRYKLAEMSFLFWTFKVCLKSHRSISTDVTIFPGNSGSPLLDIYGNVVGVVFAANSRTNWGHAVPFKDLQELLKAY